MDEYKLEGGSFYDDYNEVLEDCKAYSHKIDSLNVVCMDMEKKGIPGDSIRKVYASAKEWYGNILKIKSDYVRQNPDKDVSVYVMSQLTRDQLGDAFNVLTDRVKEGMMAPLYQRMREGYEKELARDKAKEAMKPGNPAPEFTLKDLDGKNFDLSSLRGKYVVLDFWGSWCGWCIKGIPEMKKAYEKYKGKIEFVGIDCNDTEDKWKKAVAEHQLPWINVRLFNTFAKSMAGIGAFVCGPRWLINLLRYNMRSQLYAKSLPMPMVIGALKRLDLIRKHPEYQEKLWEITRALQGGLKENGFEIGVTQSPVTPVYMKGGIPEATNLIVDLREKHNLFCSVVVYPVIPKGEIILRLIPTAAHTLDDVKFTIEAFKAIRDKLESGFYRDKPVPMKADEGFSVR